jgi:pyruvate,water dikinase
MTSPVADPKDQSVLAVLPLDSLAEGAASRVGGKAATLASLARAGFPVPDGFVVGPEADVESTRVRAKISEALEALGGGAVAVRSSARSEDLADASFAGQYESVLGAQGIDALCAAIRTVRASAATSRVERYRADRSAGEAESIPVLVQTMVPAETAGVAFTADPLTGARDVTVVSAVPGLGDRLVGGQEQPDEWAVRNGVATPTRTPPRASEPELVLAVAELVRRVEAVTGVPQDVEWAAAGGKIFLLQARPMTALPESVRWDPGQPGVWLRNFRLGEWLGDPVTPLFESWALARIEARLNQNLAATIGVPVPEPQHVIVNGWYFYGFNIIPARPQQMLAMFVRHVLPGLIRRPRRAAMAFPPLAPFGVGLYEREWREIVRPAYRRLVDEARRDVESADGQRLMRIVDELGDAAGEYFTSIAMVGGYASKAELPLAQFFRQHLADHLGGSHLDLLTGLGGTRPEAADHAVQSLDWFVPTLAEAGLAPDQSEAGARYAAARERRQKAESAARATLADRPTLHKQFDTLLGTAQRYALLREELAPELTLGWPVLRRSVHRLGELLVGRGVLRVAEQIFFLTRDEVEAALDGSEADRSTVAEARRPEWERQRRLVPPLVLGEMPPMLARLLASAEEVVRGAAAARPRAGDLIGIPASPGRATGPARIVRTLDEFDRVRPGDVLVSPVTAPAWTALFGRIAAVVTDTGGVAAHASIVAREYGLPAVVGTGDATLRLRDGEPVEVDGSAGVVRQIAR